MAIKLKAMKKKLILQSTVLTGILAVLIGAFLFLSNKVDELNAASQTLQGDVAAMNVQKQNLEGKLRRARQSLSIYKQMKQQLEGDGLSLNPTKAQMIINQIKDRYLLANMKMRIEPPQTISTEKFRSESYALIGSKITINCTAFSDEYLFSFINDVMRKMPGFVRLSSMILRRSGDLNMQAINDMSKGKAVTLATGDLTFYWIGVKPDKSAAGAKP